MQPELVGQSWTGPAGRRRPVGGGPFTVAALGVALLPIRPAWLWAVLIAAVSAVPWLLGAVRPRRRSPYWRLSPAGLEQIGPDGRVVTGYARERIEELALTAEDGYLTVFHKFGRAPVGELAWMGFEPLAFYVTARRLGLPMRVLDGDAGRLADSGLAPADRPSPDHTAEARLLAQEADLLAAAHEPRPVLPERRPPARLNAPPPVPGRARATALGVLVAVLGALMVARTAVDSPAGPPLPARLAAAGWTLAALVALYATHRRLLRERPVRWTITSGRLVVHRGRARRPRRGDRGRRVHAADIAALVVGPGVRVDPVTGAPGACPLAVLAFDHRMGLLARLPADGLEEFQLVHELHERGYRVITPGARAPRPSGYGLDGLPEVFAQVPGGRLVVTDDGLGWADAAGEVVLRMPEDRIGGIELLTIDGHAWLRLHDTAGEEFFSAPLSALRISRTDLREQARKAGLPVTDAEYDAYLSAAFHSAVEAMAGPSKPAADEAAPDDDGPGVLLDATRRSRVGTYLLSVVMCEVVAVLGALWVGDDLGGPLPTLGWAAPAGLLIGLAGYWIYDRNRDQLQVSPTGIAVVSRRGRVAWNLTRGTVGGIGIDDSVERVPRLVVWSPAGRVLRQVSFPPDLDELRRACERYGLPWGPPDADRTTPPPPEL
ncbi:hypothetical protein SAMN04489712_13329 [Thermomonospora echinospora]|uniref:Uncharacterized protein n=1 Tax=Thermomonospora echinospora TaxID=1992 RepID=A0A1H6E459_9ACTN|nr:hypothetical protein [Thermomonospora echinospora]SEG92367.1 hypothetical protein SAMN04489712_13329 [Thermomonospora echinospora]